MSRRYEVLSHTADTGIVAHGATLSEVFENAAYAMFDLMFGTADLADRVRMGIEVDSPTLEDLLVDWLSTLLFEAEANDLAFLSFEIDLIGEGRVSGRVEGVAVDRLELIGPPVKAVTYHDLMIKETSSGWKAQVVLDV